MRNFNTISALNLPLSLNVQSRYERGSTETWTRRSIDGFQALITSDRRTVPDISVRWSWRPPARFVKLISMLQVNGRYVVTEQQTVIPTETGGLSDRSSQTSRSQPISGSITWAFLGNLTTNGSVDKTHREDNRPGSLTVGDTKRMSVDLARNFPLPKKWNTRTGQMRGRFSFQSEETVATVGGSSDATLSTAAPTSSVLTNNGRQAFNVNADTDLSELLTFSLTGSHVLTFDRNYNRRLSNTVVSVVLQLRFFAGELR